MRKADTPPASVSTEIWETAGITEHMGGLRATRRLLQLCAVSPGQTVLDVGCGTGYTACRLAREYGARVVALDASPTSVAAARRRLAGAPARVDRVLR